LLWAFEGPPGRVGATMPWSLGNIETEIFEIIEKCEKNSQKPSKLRFILQFQAKNIGGASYLL